MFGRLSAREARLACHCPAPIPRAPAPRLRLPPPHPSPPSCPSSLPAQVQPRAACRLAAPRLLRVPVQLREQAAAAAARGVQDYLPQGLDQHLLQPPATWIRPHRCAEVLTAAAARHASGRLHCMHVWKMSAQLLAVQRAAAVSWIHITKVPAPWLAASSLGSSLVPWLLPLVVQLVRQACKPAQRHKLHLRCPDCARITAPGVLQRWTAMLTLPAGPCLAPNAPRCANLLMSWASHRSSCSPQSSGSSTSRACTTVLPTQVRKPCWGLPGVVCCSPPALRPAAWDSL